MRACLAATGLALSLLSGPALAQPDIAALQTRAASGDAEAHHALGEAYLHGDGVAVDFDAARRHLDAGWSAGDAQAGLDLAELILFEFDAETQAAINILNELSEDEEVGAPASLMLGEALFFGPPETLDEARALILARSALDRNPGLFAAYFLLGIGAYEGIGAEASPLQAMALWSQGAHGGDIPSMLALADSLRNGDAGSVDLIEARALYAAAAALGDGSANEMVEALNAQMSETERATSDQRTQALLAGIG